MTGWRDPAMSLDGRSVLALNLGSTGLKAVGYSLTNTPASRPRDAMEAVRVRVQTPRDSAATAEHDAWDWLDAVARQLPHFQQNPDVIVHRIVHGGDRDGPMELTPETLTELQALAPLAPLHQPPALALVRAAIRRWPTARQLGAFDTSWHQTMPEKHRLFPIPYALFSDGVKRYGFHGLAFQSAMRQLSTIAPEFSAGRVVLAHLGGGSSLCAVLDGKCVATTMGMTPLGGIGMSSRSGSLDPGVLLHLQRSIGMSPDEIDNLLWRDSGLKGLSGESGDMRKLLASGSAGARRAIEVYVSDVVQGIAAMAACIEGCDALIFSGGIGTHGAEVRARVTSGLRWMGVEIDPALNGSSALNISHATAAISTFVLHVDEEQEMVGAVAMLELQEDQQSQRLS